MSETRDESLSDARGGSSRVAGSSKNLLLPSDSDASKPQGAETKAESESAPHVTECVSSKTRGDSKRIQLSYLDYLANPLRTDHPFGKYNLIADGVPIGSILE